MTNSDRSVVENMIRLVQRARSMDGKTAAAYLEPLLQLDHTFPDNKAANAVRAVSDLVATLHEPGKPKDEIWERVLRELYDWKNTPG